MSHHHLAYIIAFDPIASPGNRMMAKMLASSLLRTYFSGDVMVFRNSPEPLFRMERKGLEEVFVEAPQMGGLEGAEEAWCWKYRVRQFIDAGSYDKILFLDADCLALRNLDHLLEGDWDVAYQPESGLNITLPQFSAFLSSEEMNTLRRNGINSGHLAVRGSCFQEVMAEWERIDTGPVAQRRHCLDQGSWNRLVLDAETAWRQRAGTGALVTTGGTRPQNSEELFSGETKAAIQESAGTSASRKPWRAVPFERGEIQFPMYLNPKYSDYREAALVHCLGGDTREKLRFMFGLFMSTFYFDDTSTVLNLFEM